MTIKWHGLMSSTRNLPGGNPQGCTFGMLGFKASSNKNAAHVSPDMKFKFVDDLSILEKINLIIAGLMSHNFRDNIASDIGINQKMLPSENIETQRSLDAIQKWTSDNKMKLNPQKTKAMIFNFTDLQFTTRLYLENNLLEIISETKLLGTIITSDLKWHKNTQMLVSKAFTRMIILHKLIRFDPPKEDLLTIYKMYIRSILEHNCKVWHHGLTEEDIYSIERVQKIACKLILRSEYQSYEQALKDLSLETLVNRRNKLSLKFAKKCTSHPKLQDMFPRNNSSHHFLRKKNLYHVEPARTGRLLNSAIPQLQRALNKEALKKH